jgi:uncharacterized protein
LLLVQIGVVSDTHGYYDPKLTEIVAGVDLILHGGDVGKQEVLDTLSSIATVKAVCGNVDSPLLELPPSLCANLDGVQVEMLHIIPEAQYDIEKWSRQELTGKALPPRAKNFRRQFQPQTRVVIFGHSHEPCLTVLQGTLFFNPGSAGKKRFSLPRCCGLLEITTGELYATVVPLEQYNGELPIDIQMKIGV